ncbi:MAG: 6-bladed beta-propeller [Acidobacteriota bacterium]
MKRSTLPSGIFLLALIPAILRPQGQKPYPVVTEVKDGVRTVTNPDFPRDGRFVAWLCEEMSCDGEGGAEAGLLNKPTGLDVDGRGNVYVMDSGDFAIKVYDNNGRFLRPIGRQGQGPGELSDLACFKLMNDGRICVLDVMQHRIMIMSDDGRYLSGFPLAGFCNTLALDGRDRVFIGKWAAVKQTDQLSTEFQDFPYVTTVFRTDASGRRKDILRSNGTKWSSCPPANKRNDE